MFSVMKIIMLIILAIIPVRMSSKITRFTVNLLYRWRVHTSLHVAIVAHSLFKLVLTFAWRLGNSCPPWLFAVLFGLNINSV